MRAYAQFLDLDSGALSLILSEIRKLPQTHWVTTTPKLKLKANEKQSFYQSLWMNKGLKQKMNNLLADQQIFFHPKIILKWKNYKVIKIKKNPAQWRDSLFIKHFAYDHCSFFCQIRILNFFR